MVLFLGVGFYSHLMDVVLSQQGFVQRAIGSIVAGDSAFFLVLEALGAGGEGCPSLYIWGCASQIWLGVLRFRLCSYLMALSSGTGFALIQWYLSPGFGFARIQ